MTRSLLSPPDPVRFLLAAAMRMPRDSIEQLTEGLIAGLDRIDGDVDLEDGHDAEEVRDV